jgi:hypothetical protein
VHGQEIPVVEVTDSGIPTAASTRGTQNIDTLKDLFQLEGIVIEVLAVSAASLIW